MFTKLIFRAMLLFASFCTWNLQAQPIIFAPGTILTYEVNAGRSTYFFMATLKEVGENIVFDYEMTEPVSSRGQVSLSAKALNTAYHMVNYFGGGPMELVEATTLFLCRSCFTDATTGLKELTLAFDDEPEPAVFNAIYGPFDAYTVEVDGETQTIPTYTLYAQFINEEGHEEYTHALTVLDNLQFPLIAFMDIGFTIGLREVTSPN